MQGYEMKFNVYADSQAEADAATLAVKALISNLAMRGIAVRASKIEQALSKWGASTFVSNYFK